MNKLKKGRWQLPVKLINFTLGTNLAPNAHIFLTEKKIQHIQDRHPQQIEAIAAFFNKAIFAEPSYLGHSSGKIYLIYSIDKFDRFEHIRLIASSKKSFGPDIGILTSYLMDKNDLESKLSRCIILDPFVNSEESPYKGSQPRQIRTRGCQLKAVLNEQKNLDRVLDQP